MKRKKIWLVVVILFLLAGSALFVWKHRTRVKNEIFTIAHQAAHPVAPSPLYPGTFRDSLSHNAINRTFVIHMPPSYKPDVPTPVVLMFHGRGGSGVLFEMSGMDDVADREGFIVVYPNAGSTDRSWNDGGVDTGAETEGINDVSFVSELIDFLGTKAKIDSNRIYAAGMSNGAMLCHRLGCELSDKIAAIGTVSGTIMVDKCEPSRPVPIIIIHGTDDPLVTWDGGPGTGRDHTSVPRTIELWKSANGCVGDTNLPYFETGNVHAEYQGDCGDGADIVLCTVEGGGHEWPVNDNFNVNEVLWKFFKEHPLAP